MPSSSSGLLVFALSSGLGWLAINRQKRYFEHQSAGILAKIEASHLKDLDSIRKQAEEEASSFRYELSTARDEARELQAKVNQLQKSMDGDSGKHKETIAAAQAEVERLTNQLESRQADIARHFEELAALKSSHDAASAQQAQQLQQHQDKVAALQAQIQSDRSTSQSEKEELSKQLQEAQKTHEQSRGQLEIAHSQAVEELNRQLQGLQQEHRSTSDQLSQARADVEAAEKSKTDLKSELESTRKALQEAKAREAKLASAEQEKTNALSEVKKLQTKIQQLEEASAKDQSAAKEQMSQLEAQLTQMVRSCLSWDALSFTCSWNSRGAVRWTSSQTSDSEAGKSKSADDLKAAQAETAEARQQTNELKQELQKQVPRIRFTFQLS